MRVLMVSDTGLSLGLAMRVDGDGHDVRYLNPIRRGSGLIKHFDSKEAWAPDIVIYESNQFAREAEHVRAQGFKVLGPSRWSTMVETDASYREQIISSLGWNTDQLTHGTNFYITCWFNGADFISSYASILYRRLMPGGVGPDVQCTGIVSDFRGLTDKTQTKILRPLERILKKVNHRGCVHIHALVDGDKFCVKEIFGSFVHPLSLLLYENTNLSVSDIMLKLLDETSRKIYTNDKWASCLQISSSPFPYTQDQSPREIKGLDNGSAKHVWLVDAQKTDGKFMIGQSGLIGYITARGVNDPTNTFENVECIRRMYRTASKIEIDDIQYRNDIGRNIHGLLKALRQPGWLA